MTTINAPRAWQRLAAYQGNFADTCDGTNAGFSAGIRFAWTDTRVGSDNPRWRDQVRNGVQAGTSLSGSKVRVYSWGITTSYVDYTVTLAGCKKPRMPRLTIFRGHFFKPDGPDFTIPSLPVPTALRAKALAGFYQRARKTQRQFQSGVFLGELRETLRMLRNPLSALRSGVDRYERELKRATRHQTDSRKLARASGLWLEYQYGWKPLWSDVNELLDVALDPIIHRESVRIRYQTSSETSLLSSDRVSDGGIGMQLATLRNKIQVTSNQCRIIGVVRSGPFALRVPGVVRYGLSPSDFIPTLYELMPWSFLIDYFTSLGDVIDSLAFQSCNSGWAVETQRAVKRSLYGGVLDEQYVRGNVFVPVATFKDVKFWHVPSPLAIVSTRITRTPHDSLPVVPLTFRLPGSSTKYLNIGALISSRARWKQ